MSVIHYSNQIVDILKPQNITSTHVTVSIKGTSKFFISKKENWFTGHWSKMLGQVMLFYLQPAHRLHVFLQPRSVDPREVHLIYPPPPSILPHSFWLTFINSLAISLFFQVEKCNKDYTLIQTVCECMLKYECVYSMSCDPVEEHGLSETPKIQPVVSIWIRIMHFLKA